MTADVVTLMERSNRVETGDIDFDDFRAHPLGEAALRCLRYMHDVEGHTMCYLRDVLATRAHKDPEITAFLSCWAYEEYWHGEALARVLSAHGERSGTARLGAVRRRLPRRDVARPLLFTIASSLSDHLPALLMAWGAVNEWSTQAGYARLSLKEGHPVLSELLGRIMRQEGRHIDFYVLHARRRLHASRAAQRTTRLALQRLWSPVGTGVMPASDVDFLIDHLFGDEDGLGSARRIDRHVDRLPGLDGLHLVERAVAERRGRAEPTDDGRPHYLHGRKK